MLFVLFTFYCRFFKTGSGRDSLQSLSAMLTHFRVSRLFLLDQWVSKLNIIGFLHFLSLILNQIHLLLKCQIFLISVVHKQLHVIHFLNWLYLFQNRGSNTIMMRRKTKLSLYKISKFKKPRNFKVDVNIYWDLITRLPFIKKLLPNYVLIIIFVRYISKLCDVI